MNLWYVVDESGFVYQPEFTSLERAERWVAAARVKEPERKYEIKTYFKRVFDQHE